MRSSLHQAGTQSITKGEVPFMATPTGVTGLFAVLLVFYLVILARFRIYPGVAEVCIGTVFGTPRGLLTAFGWRGRIKRAATRNRDRTGVQLLWPPLELDPGPDLLLWIAGLPIAIGAFAAHYVLWRAMPGLGMPWAHFADVLSFGLPEAGGLAFPCKSWAAMITALALITYLVMTMSMLVWYRDLPRFDASVREAR